MPRPKTLTCIFVALTGCLLLLAGCEYLGVSSKPDKEPTSSVKPTSFATRASRRAYDGAPPVVAHQSFGIACTKCHTAEGNAVPTVGLAPANPHLGDPRVGSLSNCRQCHVFAQTVELFTPSEFAGLRQEYQPAPRAHQFAPPVIPHPTSMRANCLACHSGQAARREIVCTHPERSNCVQCHVESSATSTTELFSSTTE